MANLAIQMQMRRPVWKFHAVAVVLLTAINIILLIKLLHCSESGTQQSHVVAQVPSPSSASSASTLRHNVDVLQISQLGRWDNSRQYRIRDFAYVGRHFQVTLKNPICSPIFTSKPKMLTEFLLNNKKK